MCLCQTDTVSVSVKPDFIAVTGYTNYNAIHRHARQILQNVTIKMNHYITINKILGELKFGLVKMYKIRSTEWLQFEVLQNYQYPARN